MCLKKQALQQLNRQWSIDNRQEKRQWIIIYRTDIRYKSEKTADNRQQKQDNIEQTIDTKQLTRHKQPKDTQ